MLVTRRSLSNRWNLRQLESENPTHTSSHRVGLLSDLELQEGVAVLLTGDHQAHAGRGPPERTVARAPARAARGATPKGVCADRYAVVRRVWTWISDVSVR